VSAVQDLIDESAVPFAVLFTKRWPLRLKGDAAALKNSMKSSFVLPAPPVICTWDITTPLSASAAVKTKKHAKMSALIPNNATVIFFMAK
jgi:hypothetical protein